MDDADLGELSAAIVAHHEWLTEAGVSLAVPADELRGLDLLGVAHERSPIASAVVTSLMSLCALRTRQTIRADREEERRRAREAAATAPPKLKPVLRERAKKVAVLTDDSHFEPVKPSLAQLQERLRTAVRRLTELESHLRARHRKFVRYGEHLASGPLIDADMTRWLGVVCKSLEMDIDFFVVEMEGPVAMPPTGHAGHPDGKAWHRVKADALLTLEKAGMTSRERRSLFPASFSRKGDAAGDRRPRDRERRARKRAEKRKGSRA